MLGPDNFLHCSNTRAIFQQLDKALDSQDPIDHCKPVVALLGKSGAGKSCLCNYWKDLYWSNERCVSIEQTPMLYGEIDEARRAGFGRTIHATPTACITFSELIYQLSIISARMAEPADHPRWYRKERSLYTDAQFLWLFDQVCREVRRLRVRALIIDNAHLLDDFTLRKLMQVRQKGQVTIVLSAQLKKNEELDEPLGDLFAKVPEAEMACTIENTLTLDLMTEHEFYDSILPELFTRLGVTGIADELLGDEQAEARTLARLWQYHQGDWHRITQLTRRLHRALSLSKGQRGLLTSAMLDQVLGGGKQ
jgi:hypothetical protein